MKKLLTSSMLFLAFLSAAILFGCGKTATDGFRVYFPNKEATLLVPLDYVPKELSSELIVYDLIQRLAGEPWDSDLKPVMPSGIGLIGWTFDNRQVSLNFTQSYLDMSTAAEVLCRAAMVLTLTQAEDVDGVFFFVEDSPLLGADGIPIGLMTADSFVENPGERIEKRNAELSLYFSNEEGTGLVKEIQEVPYEEHVSMEKLVMERLLAGPSEQGAMSAIPPGTRLLNISVFRGLCFVNLSERFLEQDYYVEEGVVIYSIVNSLSELPQVSIVQIAVDGNTNITYRDQFSLNATYKRNLDYLDDATADDPEHPPGRSGRGGVP